jgi:hypothetical protein
MHNTKTTSPQYPSFLGQFNHPIRVEFLKFGSNWSNVSLGISKQKYSKITKDLKKGPKCWQEGAHSKNFFCLFCGLGIHEQLSKRLDFKNCK